MKVTRTFLRQNRSVIHHLGQEMFKHKMCTYIPPQSIEHSFLLSCGCDVQYDRILLLLSYSNFLLEIIVFCRKFLMP